jgi:hypothetical protein
MRVPIGMALVGSATFWLGCFSKPGFTGKEDAAIDASLDGSLDGSVDAPSCVFPSNVDFPNRNALAVGDISGDGLDDVALFGTEQGTDKRQMIFVYFGGDRQIKFGCPDQTIVAPTLGPLSRIGLVKLSAGKLSYVMSSSNKIQLTQITFSGRVQGNSDSSVGLTNANQTGWDDDRNISRVPRAAFISDRRTGFNEILFGGGNAVMSAAFVNGQLQPQATEVQVTVGGESDASFYGVLPIGGNRLAIVTSRIAHAFSIGANATSTLTTTPATEIVNSGGDPGGAVFGFRDLNFLDSNQVIGLRFPQWGTFPPRLSFQAFYSGGVARQCRFDGLLSANRYLTDGTVLTPFGGFGTSFIGVITQNPSGSPLTNQLVVIKDWNAGICDTASPEAAQIYPVRGGSIEDSEPIMVGGTFSRAKQQVLLFYRQQPSNGECFEPLVDGNNSLCVARCGEPQCAPR